MAKPPAGTLPEQQGTFYRVDKIRRHLLLCAGPDCVEAAAGEASWVYLKRRIAELQLHLAPYETYRTRCQCLRICTDGPILVVYPDGIWYRHATPEVLERVLQEHLLGGKVVEEFAFARHPLPAENEARPLGNLPQS